ncbi:MAG: hypothetical protein NTY98_04890 [Verrucomicrobia bacterium]|nr:hypothetical protein [Verrucomicrobiota bacterium]
MKKSFSIFQTLKGALPASVLNFLRFCYSPSYRMWKRSERLQKRIGAAWQEVAIGSQILCGPFQGMLYVQESVCSSLPPKILGTYEMELHGLMEVIVDRSPSCIIDIGAAEGFYAVGLAKRLPNCRVVAFESDKHGQDLLFQLAALNGVADRIEIKGYCSVEELRSFLDANPNDCIVICDAEGAEIPLLDPILLPSLTKMTLLVELHPWVHPEVKAVLYSRFQAVSAVKTIASRPREPADFPREIKKTLSVQTKLDCMNELRPSGMEWLWIEPSIR